LFLEMVSVSTSDWSLTHDPPVPGPFLPPLLVQYFLVTLLLYMLAATYLPLSKRKVELGASGSLT
jgi:hypothetical protein